MFYLDVRGFVHHSTIHAEIVNKMQQCIKIYYSTFLWSSTCFGRHTPPSSGAQNYTSSLWFCIRERLLDVEVSAILSSWWWTVCHPKHV